MRYTACWLSLIPLLAPSAMANPPCRVRAVKKVAAKVIVKKEIVPTAVFVSSYTATLAPYAVAAPLYAPPPPAPPAPVAAPAPVYPQQQAVSYGQLQVQQYAQKAVQTQAVCPPCPPCPMPARQAVAQVDDEVLLTLRQLCVLLERRQAPQLQQEGYQAQPVPQVMPQRALGQVNHLQSAFMKCATCHDSGFAEGRGRGFVMFEDGKPVTFTHKQLLDIVTKSQTNAMPPPNNILGIPPLTDPEASAIASWAARQKGEEPEPEPANGAAEEPQRRRSRR